jgi:hypothetical protein
VTVLVGQGGGVTIQTLYVEFSTRFVSGEVFDTLNSSELSAFPPGPLTIRTQTPSVKEPHELYELHKHVMRTNPVRAKKMMYEPGQAEEYLIQYAFIKSYDEQVARGWLYFDESCACYRPTMKGAYLMTWGLVQPFKAIRMSRLKRQERAVLAEFERERTG